MDITTDLIKHQGIMKKLDSKVDNLMSLIKEKNIMTSIDTEKGSHKTQHLSKYKLTN